MRKTARRYTPPKITVASIVKAERHAAAMLRGLADRKVCPTCLGYQLVNRRECETCEGVGMVRTESE